ncbi:MAG: hypothetical protein E2O70_05715 [Candidatus Dadabacteria bacterium]|nr:hypothetical protein [Candidatus Dadabacteria bacterium]TDJ00414.1 MAG: hypothetical protein E2O70_05715 [Candidatus Dadabacteria bacterium]
MYMISGAVTINQIGGTYDETNQQLCNAGDVTTGGGWSLENDVTIGNAQIIGDAPIPVLGMLNDPPVGWVGRVTGTGSANFDFTVWVICISNPNN